jgi:tartrate dehydratase alpha subunit/fumarate hydratase class I-like protein
MKGGHEKEYAILRTDGKLLCFASGETVFYGDRKEAEEDCRANDGDVVLELTIRHDDANAAMPPNEQVVRICPDTGLPVVAVHRGYGLFLCLHNDSAEEDAQAVRNWIESNGKNPNPDKITDL